MRKREKLEKTCKNCEKQIPNRNIYCDNKCQNEYQGRVMLEQWQRGEIKGYVGKQYQLRHWLRRHLIEESNECCTICGFSGNNVLTGNSILEIDHIDGDPSNDCRENLRVICPNCHAMTSTFRNSGNRRSCRNKKV